MNDDVTNEVAAAMVGITDAAIAQLRLNVEMACKRIEGADPDVVFGSCHLSISTKLLAAVYATRTEEGFHGVMAQLLPQIKKIGAMMRANNTPQAVH